MLACAHMLAAHILREAGQVWKGKKKVNIVFGIWYNQMLLGTEDPLDKTWEQDCPVLE